MAERQNTEGTAAARATWSKRGEAWNKTSPDGASTADTLNQRMIEAAGIRTGDHVVDIASGAGEPSISAALTVGPAGRVTGTDIAQPMLAGARRRARNLGLTNIAYAVGDMTALPYPDSAFDALTCRFALMFPPDPAVAARDGLRVLKPGKRAVYAVHGPYEDDPMYKIVRETVFAFLGRPAPDAPYGRHSLGAAGAVTRVLTEAGFSGVEEISVRNTVTFGPDEPFWITRLQRGHSVDYNGLDDAGRIALGEAVKDACAPYLDGAEYSFGTHTILGIGTA